MWFLFPYGFICLFSPWLFYVMRRIGYIKALMITALIHVLTCYLISRYGTTFLYGNQLVYMPILILHLLYAFTVGTVLILISYLTAIPVMWSAKKLFYIIKIDNEKA